MLTICREYRGNLIEFARGNLLNAADRRELVVHLERCADCSRFQAEQEALSAMEVRLGAVPVPTSDPFGTRAMAEFDSVRAWRPRRRRAMPWVLAGVSIAGLSTAAALILATVNRQVPAPQAPPALAAGVEARSVTIPMPIAPEAAPGKPVRRVAPQPPRRPPEAPYFMIPFAAPLTPEERPTVLQMDIPVPALIAAGFPMGVADPGATVKADVLVSQDGRARAIRPISISNSN